MKKRVISAAIAIILLAPVIYFGKIYFGIACALIGMYGYKEILDLKKAHKEIPLIPTLVGLLALLCIIISAFSINSFDSLIKYEYILFPMIIMPLLTIFYRNDEYSTKDAFYLLGMIYFLGMVFSLFIIIRNTSLLLFLYLLSITIVTDMFAYFVGMLIGSHKMAPVISPNKSWEGSIAGTIAGTFIPVMFYSYIIDEFSIKILVITFILTIVGQLGDLLFSKIKRENEIKDFSNIMPGHGGVLDRLDSFSVVVLAYVLIIQFL